MSIPDSFTDLITRWPRKAAGLAEDLDVPALNVRGWKRDNTLPSQHFERVAALAPERGMPDVNLAVLARLAAKKKGIEPPEAAEPVVPAGGPAPEVQTPVILPPSAPPTPVSQLNAIAAELGELAEGDGGPGPIRPDVKPDEAA